VSILRNTDPATDREGVEDAVLRLVEGLDKADTELLTSAFTEDVVYDLGGLDASLGAHAPYEGRDVVVEQLMSRVGRLDSMHAITNVRVEVDGDRAHLTCYLIAQHHRPDQGPSVEFADHLWLGNFLDTHLVRDDGHAWRISHHRVDGSWASGSLAAMQL
jgi:SnoaL-like domain